MPPKTAILPAALLAGAVALLAPTLAAHAQSVGAPAGREPATAPGGTEGLAGARNEGEAIRSGDAIPVPPGRAVTPPPPGTAPEAVVPPPPARP
jgi:hypothetical protein